LIPYQFHFEAEEELAETAMFYESRMIGLGGSFTSEIQRTVNLIREYPDSGWLLGQKVRRVLVRRFPYRFEPHFHIGNRSPTPSSRVLASTTITSESNTMRTKDYEERQIGD
jgi:hypothetical protein